MYIDAYQLPWQCVGLTVILGSFLASLEKCQEHLILWSRPHSNIFLLKLIGFVLSVIHRFKEHTTIRLNKSTNPSR